jgi:probable phosphoglycerate mutase
VDVSPLGLPFGRLHIEVLRLREDRASIQRQVEDLFRLEDEAATEVLLIRHAEPACNDISNEDPLLSCTGLEQAERLGERLSSLWFDAIYAAPERRAQQTARLLGEATDSEVVTVEDLREIEYMPAAPQPWAPVANYTPGRHDVPSTADRFMTEPRWDALPGFAPSRCFRQRVLQGIELLMTKHPARRIAVVTHSSVINAYLSALLAILQDVFFAPKHTSISCVRSLGELFAVRSLNDTAHLLGQETPRPRLAKDVNGAFIAVNNALTQPF